jgi:NADPH:quinone reductase-like Zn-dependent oxidoreductase
MLSAGQIDPPVNAVHSFDDVPAALARRAEDASGQSVVTLAPATLA